MIFDIDKFITIPRNSGHRYQDPTEKCCTIGAAFYACGGTVSEQENDCTFAVDRAFRDVSNWLYGLKLNKPFLYALLSGAEHDHMRKRTPEMATKTVIDALLMNRNILALEGVEVTGASEIELKQLVA